MAGRRVGACGDGVPGRGAGPAVGCWTDAAEDVGAKAGLCREWGCLLREGMAGRGVQGAVSEQFLRFHAPMSLFMAKFDMMMSKIAPMFAKNNLLIHKEMAMVRKYSPMLHKKAVMVANKALMVSKITLMVNVCGAMVRFAGA